MMDADNNSHDIGKPARGGRGAAMLARLAWLNPAARIEPTDPGKELRFTRAGQATHFAVGAVLCACAAFALLTLGLWPWHADGSALLDIWWPGLLPFLPMAVCLWLAVYCACHAYVILSPVGVEIFPLWLPARHFRLVPWAMIRQARAEGGAIVLEFGEAGEGGVILGLGPLRPPQREMLLRAIQGRLAA